MKQKVILAFQAVAWTYCREDGMGIIGKCSNWTWLVPMGSLYQASKTGSLLRALLREETIQGYSQSLLEQNVTFPLPIITQNDNEHSEQHLNSTSAFGSMQKPNENDGKSTPPPMLHASPTSTCGGVRISHNYLICHLNLQNQSGNMLSLPLPEMLQHFQVSLRCTFPKNHCRLILYNFFSMMRMPCRLSSPQR